MINSRFLCEQWIFPLISFHPSIRIERDSPPLPNTRNSYDKCNILYVVFRPVRRTIRSRWLNKQIRRKQTCYAPDNPVLLLLLLYSRRRTGA